MSLANDEGSHKEFNTDPTTTMSEQYVKSIVDLALNSNDKIEESIDKLLIHLNNPILKKIVIENIVNLTKRLFEAKPKYVHVFNYAFALKEYLDPNKYVQMMIDSDVFTFEEIMHIIKMLKPNINLFLNYFLERIDEHSTYGVPLIFDEICAYPGVDQSILENILISLHNVKLISRYLSIFKNRIINLQAIQTCLLNIYKSEGSGPSMETLINFTAYECKNGADILLTINALIKQANYPDTALEQLLKTIIENGNKNYINSNIIDELLSFSADYIMTILVDNELVTAEYIVEYMVKNNINNDGVIISICAKLQDFKLLNEFILKNKSVYLASHILRLTNENKDIIHINGFNALFLQTIVEKNGTSRDLDSILHLNQSNAQLNFASLKKRFNSLKEKEYLEDPAWLATNIETAKGGNRLLPLVTSDFLRINPSIMEQIKLLPKYKHVLDTILLEDKTLTFTDELFRRLIMSKVHSTEIKQLVDYLVSKKDWLCMEFTFLETFIKNPYINFYKLVKNKTWIDMYHEVYKNNYPLVRLSSSNYNISNEEYKYDFNQLLANKYGILKICAEKSTNFAEFAKYMAKLSEATAIFHNEGTNDEILLFSITNKTFDLGNKSNVEFLSLVEDNIRAFQRLLYDNNANDFEDESNLKLLVITDKINLINQSSNKELINLEQFKKDFEIIKNLIKLFFEHKPIQWKTGTEEYNALKRMFTNIELLNNFETIKEHLSEAKPKNEKLKDFNLSINGFDFKVLEYLDPKAFTIGADTDCCQRVGGAGEMAAIDSFISPLASVLILYKNDTIISQSYFHYVPEENGLILDNVEWSEANANGLKITPAALSKLYADYAAAIKSKYPGINYIKCGMDYNKIDNNLFGKSNIEKDPRYFSVEDPYSDFDIEEHLDLLKPSDSIKQLKVIAYNINHSTKQIIKHSMVRTWFFKSLLN